MMPVSVSALVFGLGPCTRAAGERGELSTLGYGTLARPCDEAGGAMPLASRNVDEP